jgi:hypothetical protein
MPEIMHRMLQLLKRARSNCDSRAEEMRTFEEYIKETTVNPRTPDHQKKGKGATHDSE